MTKEQHQEFIEFALELKWNRDFYSRARIIEELMDKVDELVKNCSIPAVSNSCCDSPELDKGMQLGFGKTLCKSCGCHIAI